MNKSAAIMLVISVGYLSAISKANASEPTLNRKDPSVSIFHSFSEMEQATNPVLAPVEALTNGPKFHWFGYYLHDQWDATGRYLLCHQADFEHRLSKAEEAIKVGMIDLEDGNRWIELGKSRAWSWQQGCFLQWRPGRNNEVVWNDRQGNRAVCRILNINTRKMRTLPMAIDEAISPDGKWALCTDFSRTWQVRPGYGYPDIENETTLNNAPENAGIWRMDMDTGETKLIISMAKMLDLPFNKEIPRDTYHYVNHCQWSPDGKRFSVFHRWKGRGQPTLVYTMNADGGDIRLLCAEGASHWTWRDREHVLIWANGAYRLYKDDGSGEPKETVWTAPNGHQSYVQGTENEWMLTDTYPSKNDRIQFLYLVHLPTQRCVPLGRFASASEYSGHWRCDLHPRISSSGRWIVFDSPHGGNGRQQYIIDISSVINIANK